ncbi:hypothetical protein [Persicobacter diffluens]|uniref:Outer membrane protein beta-barrel domain-containing protein n=1 Tax=Persicobacter diffluens TaxID=981 RepID=A0AAN5AMG7_9BACT|nr:hypothetical protein PEDI_29330 [Persicobacter diffluens]
MPKTTLFSKYALWLMLLTLWFKSPVLGQGRLYYSQTELEMIFSYADLNNEGLSSESPLRWAPVFNIHTHYHFDFNRHFGLFTGIGVKNMGFIASYPDIKQRIKHRTYNLEIPIALKFGKLNKWHFYGGYSFEVPIHYKEKLFLNGEKESVRRHWFSDRAPRLMHGLFAGVVFPSGTHLKVQYYLNNFLNKDFQTVDLDGNILMPYQGINANVWAISLNFPLTKNNKFYYQKSPTYQASLNY